MDQDWWLVRKALGCGSKEKLGHLGWSFEEPVVRTVKLIELTSSPVTWSCLMTLHNILIWIPLFNHYRYYRQISTIDEMDCPTLKRFNSPLTQNLFCILERIFSNNWCLGATFSDRPQVSAMFKKSNILKTNKSDSPRRPAKKILKVFFLQNSWSCPQVYRGPGRRQKSPLDGATDFLSKIWQHITAVSFVSAFIFVFARKPKNASSHVLIGPENNVVNLKHVCWFLFIQSWSSFHQVNAGKW